MENTENEEPLTPADRLFIQPEMNHVINCVIGVKNPVDVDAMISEIKASPMLKLPRFSSVLVLDSMGREHWRKTQLNVDRHIIIRNEPLTDDPSISPEDAINDYLADLAVSSPLSSDKPLWEVRFLVAHKCGVLRAHHALSDGVSLMSMFLLSCRRADDPTQLPTVRGLGTSGAQRRRWSFYSLLKMVWYTVVFVIECILRSLWLKDEKSAISGGAGVELWPRKLATARFKLDDMKIVKKAVVGATINDVLFGIISCGLSRYLGFRSPPQALREGLQITGVAMVNLRPQSGLQEMSVLLNGKPGNAFGNQFGMLLLPVFYHKSGSDPLQFVKRAKKLIDKKKLSLEGFVSHKVVDLLMSLFGPKLVSWLTYRILSNTSFTISNMVGPSEEITVSGNPIAYLRVNSSSLPHAITMHMVSYAGTAEMQIMVAKDLIPNPQILAGCLEDALLLMKDSALASARNRFRPQTIKMWLISRFSAY